MITCRRVAVFAVLSFALSLHFGSALGGAERSSEPEFRRDSATEAFAAGMKHFKGRAYSKARAEFKKSRSSAKSREDRELVDQWIKATYGGEEFMGMRRLVMRAQHRQAYDDLTESYTKYLGTPIQSEYVKLWKTLGSRVTTVIEGFDSHSKYYEKKPSRTFVDDPEKVLTGTHSLACVGKSNKTTETIALRRFPDDWSQYEEVELWYNARTAPLDMHLELTCGRRGEDDNDDTRDHKLSAHIRMKGKGWQRLRLPLDKFDSTGLPCLTKVRKVELKIKDKRKYDFMLDGIALVRAQKDM